MLQRICFLQNSTSEPSVPCTILHCVSCLQSASQTQNILFDFRTLRLTVYINFLPEQIKKKTKKRKIRQKAKNETTVSRCGLSDPLPFSCLDKFEGLFPVYSTTSFAISLWDTSRRFFSNCRLVTQKQLKNKFSTFIFVERLDFPEWLMDQTGNMLVTKSLS